MYDIIDFGGKLSGSKANLEYEILNIERIIDGLLSIPSVFIKHWCMCV